jgi:DNA-directed RNA polymerase sigma subunit (sigma70/sigma32)
MEQYLRIPTTGTLTIDTLNSSTINLNGTSLSTTLSEKQESIQETSSITLESKVTKMYSMFRNATSFDQDIRAWDVSQITDFSNMFTGATAMLNRYPTLNTTQGVIAWFNSVPGS